MRNYGAILAQFSAILSRSLRPLRWADLIEWLPHEELVNGEWVEVSGAARDDQADYFRSQLSLFARLSFGRNKLASSTIVELVPLEALLLLLLPETMAGQVRAPKL